MARWKFQGTTKDQSGRILPSATVSVYPAGTTTAASVYTSVTSATAVNSVTSNSTDATYVFYTDCFDYDYDQAFKIIITKSGYTSVTYDNIPHGEIVLGTYTISAAKTITTYVKIPKGVFYTKSGSGSLAFNGPTEIGLYQVFSSFNTGVTFGPASVKEVVPQWWGASGSATAAVNSAAFQSALDSIGIYPSTPLYIPGITVGSITPYQINVALTKTSADWMQVRGDGPGSWLEWTGADYATILDLRGAGSGGVSVKDIRLDCNLKATTGLELSNFGYRAIVSGCEFNDGLANIADNQGLLNIPLDGETHIIQINNNYFGGGTAIGIGLGLTGVSSGSGGVAIFNNEFQQIDNIAIKGKGLKESSITNNVIDNLLAKTNGAGFWLDIVSGVNIINNHIESCAKHVIKLNATSRYSFKSVTGRISDNLIISSLAFIDLGFTDDVLVDGNTVLSTAGATWLTVTANAFGTIVGRNAVSPAVAGAMQWAEQYVGGAGLWSVRNGITPVFSTAAIVTLDSQSVSADWVTVSTISTTNAPDIPVRARGWVLKAEIMSATVGARLYLFSAADLVAWGNRATDTRVQYVEAQTANRYNTATIILPAVNQSYEDLFSYGISSGGVTDTNIRITVVGYLMPS